jgi:hypothetical protein
MDSTVAIPISVNTSATPRRSATRNLPEKETQQAGDERQYALRRFDADGGS